MKDVVILLGSGSIGQAIARRIGEGKHVVLADLKIENANAAAKTLENAGFETSTVAADLSSRESILNLIEHAQKFGAIKNLINAAGVSPSQAPVEKILQIDLYGTAVLIEEENFLLTTTPTEKLLEIDFIKNISDTLKAYQFAKRGNCLRVMFEATRWGKRRYSR